MNEESDDLPGGFRLLAITIIAYSELKWKHYYSIRLLNQKYPPGRSLESTFFFRYLFTTSLKNHFLRAQGDSLPSWFQGTLCSFISFELLIERMSFGFNRWLLCIMMLIKSNRCYPDAIALQRLSLSSPATLHSRKIELYLDKVLWFDLRNKIEIGYQAQMSINPNITKLW